MREPERISMNAEGQKLLRVPFATQIKPEMKARGTYRKGYPEGAVVHFTAGRRKDGAPAIAYGREQGHAYFVIDAEGEIFQAIPLNKWGYHAGTSSWPKLGSSVSQFLVGIEIMAAGQVKKRPDGSFVTWFGQIIPKSEVRYSKKRENIQEGFYQVYTAAQEASLEAMILWLKRNNPNVFDLNLVLGHDEVSPGRKNDPGAALSCTMPEFRKKLTLAYGGKS